MTLLRTKKYKTVVAETIPRVLAGLKRAFWPTILLVVVAAGWSAISGKPFLRAFLLLGAGYLFTAWVNASVRPLQLRIITEKRPTHLDEPELALIGQCLKAVAHGPFLIDPSADDSRWEFPMLMGLTPTAFTDIADRWPDVGLGDKNVQLAINNALNNLLGYPHRCEAEWPRFISAPPAEVARVLDKWRRLTAQTDGKSSSGYFYRMMLK